MKQSSTFLRTAAVGSLLLFGCSHHHPATTQIAVASPPPAQNSGSTMDHVGTETGHVAGEAARDTGHGVAVAGRETGHVFAEAGRGTATLFTKSAVPIGNSKPESLSAPTIEVDEAMQARDWDVVSAHYENGSTVAGPIGFILQPAPNLPQGEAIVVEPALFAINTLIMPLDFFRTAPWTPVQWKAASVEPTYTAVPPLPPEDAP